MSIEATVCGAPGRVAGVEPDEAEVSNQVAVVRFEVSRKVETGRLPVSKFKVFSFKR